MESFIDVSNPFFRVGEVIFKELRPNRRRSKWSEGTLSPQEGESTGSSVLQLLVTDRDTPRNGPPFSFHIVSGNEERRFHVDQGGLLSLSAPLRRKVKAHHQLKIQVR